MAHIDQVYNNMVKAILRDGFTYYDASRANIEMLQIPSYTLEVDMLQGFPLLTTKRIFWKSFAHELIWMLSGSTSIKYLQENNVHIWDKDANNFKQGGPDYVGRIYGAQWRKWDATGAFNGEMVVYIDQIKELIRGLKNDLYNRRHIVTAWNPAELNNMALPPCHWSFEILPCRGLAIPTTKYKTGFKLKWHQRSCDAFLGIPFDIGLYALLARLIEKELKMPCMGLIGDLSNVHFYGPHIPLAQEQIMRSPVPMRSDMIINHEADIFNLSIGDFDIINYYPHPAIRAELYAKVL